MKLFKGVMIILLTCAVLCQSSFPTVLPIEEVKLYKKHEAVKIKLISDIITDKGENEICLKDIKSTLSSIKTIETNEATDLITIIMKKLSNIVNKIMKINFNFRNHTSQDIKEESITLPSINKMLKFYRELSFSMLALQRKNEDFSIREKRNTQDIEFPTIMSSSELLKPPVGCILRITKKQNLKGCIHKFISLIKTPKLDFIGSEIINFLIKVLRKPVPLITESDVLQIVKDLDLISEVASLNKRDKMLFPSEIRTAAHLVELLNSRLLNGPSNVQKEIYSQLGILDNQDFIENDDMVTEDEEIGTDLPEDGGTPEETTLRTVSIGTGNPETITDSNVLEQNRILDHDNNLFEKENETKDIALNVQNDSTDGTTSNTKDNLPSNALKAIADLNEAIIKEINHIKKSVEDHESKSKDSFTKNNEFITIQQESEYPLIIKNSFSTIMAYFLQLQEDLTKVETALMNNDILNLFDNKLHNRIFQMLRCQYNEITANLDLVIINYLDPLTILKYEALLFCGYKQCRAYNIDNNDFTEKFLANNLDMNKIYPLKYCSLITDGNYFCEKYFDLDKECTKIPNNCTFKIKPYTNQPYKLYSNKYLFVTMQRHENFEIENYTLEANSFHIITSNQNRTLFLPYEYFFLIGQAQNMTIIINSLKDRHLMDGSILEEWLSMTYLNSFGILSIYVILFIFIIKITYNEILKRKTRKLNKKQKYFKVGRKRIYLEPTETTTYL